jgi:hypothetical protein
VRLSLVQQLERELSRLAGRQAVKILGVLGTRRAVETKVAELVRKRHRRRAARLQQKASRQRNRR